MLYARTFDESRLLDVADLDCGNDRFGAMATEWIKCVNPDDSALQSISERQTEVFLYYLEDDHSLVGFGSIGKTERKKRGVFHEWWSIIPHLGIDVRFHGYPPGMAWHDRVSYHLMSDLIARCANHGTNTLMLKVDPANQSARKLYSRFNFVDVGVPNDEGWQKMILSLPYARTF